MTTTRTHIACYAAALLATVSIFTAASPGNATSITPPPAPSSVTHSGYGSMVDFTNNIDTREPMKVGSSWIRYGHGAEFKGAASGNDWSDQATFQDGTTVDLHANNPFTSEAYFQVGPHKIYNEAYVKHNGKSFHVKYIPGSWDVGDPVLYKLWSVTCTGSDSYYTHEFIHHLDMVDGVKGTVMNKTNKNVHVRAGGATLALTPGQRMLYFDAGLYHGDRGTEITVLRPGTDKGAFTVEAVDPSIGYPKATVVDADGHKNITHYTEKQSKSFTDSGSDIALTLTRQPDHILPCIYENHSTSDWAVFDIDITNK